MTTSTRAHTGTTAVLLTVDEAADRLDTSPRFIRRLITERRIPHRSPRRLSRHVRLLSTDIDAFIAAGRVEAVQLTRYRRR